MANETFQLTARLLSSRDKCRFNISTTILPSCSGHGKLYENGDNYECLCDIGWIGENCESAITVMDPSPEALHSNPSQIQSFKLPLPDPLLALAHNENVEWDSISTVDSINHVLRIPKAVATGEAALNRMVSVQLDISEDCMPFKNSLRLYVRSQCSSVGHSPSWSKEEQKIISELGYLGLSPGEVAIPGKGLCGILPFMDQYCTCAKCSYNQNDAICDGSILGSANAKTNRRVLIPPRDPKDAVAKLCGCNQTEHEELWYVRVVYTGSETCQFNISMETQPLLQLSKQDLILESDLGLNRPIAIFPNVKVRVDPNGQELLKGNQTFLFSSFLHSIDCLY